MHEKLRTAHASLQEQQQEIRTTDSTETLLFRQGDLVWLENRRKRKWENPKLTPNVGPYTIINSWLNHTYLIRRCQQEPWQNECRMKLYRPCDNPSGKAPYLIEPSRRPNMKGAVKRQQPTTRYEQTLNRDQILDELFPPAIATPPPPAAVSPITETTCELCVRNHQHPERHTTQRTHSVPSAGRRKEARRSTTENSRNTLRPSHCNGHTP